MPLFQKSVEKKYLRELETSLIDEKFAAYQAYFGNTEIQENIRNSKEEQFQEGFLRELFVKILGYTLNPEPNFNLTTELKNIVGAKKADGAILKNDNAVAVIELKSTSTTDLDSVEDQAFGYKNHHPKCIYVITSNFEKLRFYIQNAVEHIELNLFNLSKENFALMWLCLSKDSILKDTPLRIKESSVLEEENVTNKLYTDYSKFRESIFTNIVKNNSEIDKLLLFNKTQKLLDRFLFVFFAEDRLLLPPNSISEIVKQWTDLKDKYDEYFPLYDRFKKYFGYMNSGFKGKQYNIYPYNGGLFSPDEILDSIQIDDEVLYEHTLKLSAYDFETEVDVNILGHIFEHSLSEIENVQAEIQGQSVDKQKSKRKKDGIFYTPKYITKYIVENTVGTLCSEKRNELEIIDEDFTANRNKSTKKKLIAKLDKYREWLLSLTILDPACGSGAFLNQALDFLVEEHHKIDALKTQLLGGGLIFSDIETDILEKNIYGVDLNEESVEIAKLSLWLRTARKGRKLNTLSNNIKCGNSLIDNPEFAGEKAFYWEEEFPDIFTKGGFDVVIGNPPYVNLEKLKYVSANLQKVGFKTYNKKGDLYVLFVEQGFTLLKENGVISYIMPNKWLQAGYGKNTREFFLTKELKRIIDFGDIQIFEGATTYPCIFIAKNNSPKSQFLVSVLRSTSSFDFKTIVAESQEIFETKEFSGDTWIISSKKEKLLLNRLNQKFLSLKDFLNGNANYGIKFGLTEAFLIDNTKKHELIKRDSKSIEIIGSVLRGRDLDRYGKPQKSELDNIILVGYGMYKKIEKKYPAIFGHLLQYEAKLKQRGQCTGSKITNEKPFTGQHHWLELDNNPTQEYLALYQRPKIMYQTFQVKPCFIYDEQGLYCNNSMWIIPTENKALLGILNSKMGWWLITKYCTQIQNGYQLIWKYFGQIPIPTKSDSNLTESVERILRNNEVFLCLKNTFIELLKSKFEIEGYSRKIQSWHELEFKEFLKELSMAKVKLSLSEESEWMTYFNEQKQQATELKVDIDKIDREIDQMVYQLYGLTDKEIQIVENSV